MTSRIKELQELNHKIRECRGCRLFKTRTNAICGEGSLDARLMLIAQAPGESEDKKGKMFVGPSGKVLDKLLKEANINRREIYMTNLIKCILPKYRKPKQDEIDACKGYLDREIELIDPVVISPLGYYAARYIFDRYRIPLPSSSPSGKLDFSNFYGKLFVSQGKKILPLSHPAALLYNTSFEKSMVNTYRKLSVLLKDCKWFPVCPMKRFYEEGRLDKKWIELYCKGDWESCIRYKMEERGEFHPDWMLPDGSIDETLK